MIKFALYPYIPQRYLKKASFEDIDLHRRILDFKDGKHYAIAWAASEVCRTLSCMDLANTVIVCIQALNVVYSAMFSHHLLLIWIFNNGRCTRLHSSSVL